MVPVSPVGLLTFLTVAAGLAEAQSQLTVTGGGWTVAADGKQAVITIAHDNLGTVLKDVGLNLGGQRNLSALKNWSVEKTGEHQLSVRTTQPQTRWVFELDQGTLKISSTSTSAVLTGTAPASKDRIVARLLDPQGVPVDWLGNGEIVKSHGGNEARNRSYLPTRNPECMYFGLGPVSGSNFHSLFDRATNTAIDFPDRSLMQRNRKDQDFLDLTIPVPGDALVRVVPDYFTKVLGLPSYSRCDDSYFRTAPMGWNTWTGYYGDVREKDIVQNADWIAANLKSYGLRYVVLDEGYDRGKSGEHTWIGEWNRAAFPRGPRWLANYIKSKGLQAGVWVVPNSYAGAVEQHPEWYVRDKAGKIILNYKTPALDFTHPGVLAFIKQLFTTLDDWGFDYYKFDGEHALTKYVPGVDRQRLFDPSADPVVAYRNRLRVIRETVGPKRFIEVCPSGTPLDGIGYVDSYFNGHDVYNSWRGMHRLLGSIKANAFLNHIVVYVMPGEGMDVGAPMTPEEAKQKRSPTFIGPALRLEEPMAGFGTTTSEARTLTTHVALSGVAYSLVSVLPELPAERVKILKMTLPTLPILPMDLFSRGTDRQWRISTRLEPEYYIHNFPEIIDLKVNAKSGVYDVVGLTNWSAEKETRALSFADKLGLRAGSPCAVFDFWNQKFLGVFKDRVAVEIEPHDTRVLLIHPLLNRPQLVGLSRHITGAYSILDLSWDAAKNTLHGSSETVSGEPYTVWVHVPDGVTVSHVRASAGGTRDIAADRALKENALRVSFQGQPETVTWELAFAGQARR